ncbi:MAG: ATP phosphoribosyltransferase regulatory subunit [Lachnospiraceae bacterium]|jgi:ATP phosphoribosyltransferase regulatory subunit|nr:ATP phosphoribosyltransferase regulatory subunit [Lachnospiraceae bacterium]
MKSSLLHTPEGVRDIYGDEYARKSKVSEEILGQIHSYGYEDIQTPAFEFFDVFSNEIGTTPSRELYKFFDKDGDTLALRPDFTPSIARCAAKYFMEDSTPLRLCYSGNTYTNNSNLQGKLKEMTEIGAELISDDSVYADAEEIALLISSLQRAGLNDFQISVGNAEYFKGLCEYAGIDEETELKLKDFIAGKNYFGAEDLLVDCGISDDKRTLLLRVMDLFGSDEKILDQALESITCERSKEAVIHLKDVYDVLCRYGVEKYVSFDLGMLSKYNYYTGIIFKAFTYGAGDAIAKGGRYDSLLRQFGKNAPAIGFVIVIDDLMNAMSRQNIAVTVPEPVKKILYNPQNFDEKLREAEKLRIDGARAALIPENTLTSKENSNG